MCMLAHEEPLTKFSACLHPVPPTSQGSGVGTPGYTLHASDTPPTPQLHNWETGASESKADSLKDTCKHIHTSKDTFLLIISGTIMFSPPPKCDTPSTQTQLRAKLWARAHLHSSPWLLPPPFGHISVFPLLSLSTANPRTQNWTASFLLPLPFSQPPPPALLSLLIAAAS